MSPIDGDPPAFPLTFLKNASFLATTDLSGRQLEAVIDQAIRAKCEGFHALGQPLQGKTVALVFFNPSLRTRVSMTVAITQLGGTAVPLEVGSGTWDLEHRDGIVMDGMKVEHVKEAVPVLCQYVDAIGVRCFPGQKDYDEDAAEPVLKAFAKHATVPVINLESAVGHPCQAMADMMTIKERLGAVKGRKLLLTWANHPKPLPHAVPQSFAMAAAQCGADLWIAAPEGYQLDAAFVARARAEGVKSGGTVTETSDRDAAFLGAEIVYAKSWASRAMYGDAAKDLAARASLKAWQVTEQWMSKTDDGAFMHCLPVRRNVVVSDEVLDGSRSLVVDEAQNRLHVQRALLAGIFS